MSRTLPVASFEQVWCGAASPGGTGALVFFNVVEASLDGRKIICQQLNVLNQPSSLSRKMFH